MANALCMTAKKDSPDFGKRFESIEMKWCFSQVERTNNAHNSHTRFDHTITRTAHQNARTRTSPQLVPTRTRRRRPSRCLLPADSWISEDRQQAENRTQSRTRHRAGTLGLCARPQRKADPLDQSRLLSAAQTGRRWSRVGQICAKSDHLSRQTPVSTMLRGKNLWLLPNERTNEPSPLNTRIRSSP